MKNYSFIKSSRIETRYKINPLFILILIANLITVLSQLPDLRGEMIKQIVLFGVWCIVFFISLIRIPVRLNTNILYIIALVMCFDIYCGILSIAKGTRYLHSSLIYPVNLSLFILVIGYFMAFYLDKNKIKLICAIYISGILFVMLNIYLKYFKGVVLNFNEGYVYTSKNSIGVMVLLAAIILAIYIKGNNGLFKIVKVILITLMLLFISIIQNRASLVAALAAVVFYVLFYIPDIRKRLILFLVLVTASIASLSNTKIVKYLDSIMSISRYGMNLDKLSTGRMQLNNRAIEIFFQHPFVGIGSAYTENFQLSSLAQYGVMGALPILVLSLIGLWEFLIKSKVKKDDFVKMLGIIFVTALVISTFEELAPFGPGTRFYMMWLLTGYYYGAKCNSCENS